MPRNIRPLTDTDIRNAKPGNKANKHFDGGGLFLLVTPAGGKWWRLKYRIDGKEKLLSLGIYPDVGLKEARRRRDEARELIAKGIDPSLARKETKAAAIAEQREQKHTFAAVATDWFKTYAPDLDEKHVRKLRSYLENVLFPAIGSRSVASLLPVDILDAVRDTQDRGRIHTTHRQVQLAGQVLQYAFIKGLVSVNVARGITGALQPVRVTNFAAITEPKEIGRLLKAIDSYAGFPSIRYFLKILPYVFTRPGELRLAEWNEVNFDDAMLTIPWQRLKTKKLSKKDHRVPLARQVVSLFQELHAFSGSGRFIFPSIRAKTDTIRCPPSLRKAKYSPLCFTSCNVGKRPARPSKKAINRGTIRGIGSRRKTDGCALFFRHFWNIVRRIRHYGRNVFAFRPVHAPGHSALGGEEEHETTEAVKVIYGK